MSEDVWSKPTEEPQNPCVRRCSVSSQLGYCRSCFMTLDEMSRWETATEWERRRILEAVEERKVPK